MGAEDPYVCSAFYFSGLITARWVRAFWKVALKYANELGRELTHFGPDPFDNQGWRCKTYRYIKRNEKQLTASRIDDRLESLEFYSVAHDQDLVMSPFMIGLTNSQSVKGYGTVFMQCQTDLLLGVPSAMDFLRGALVDLAGIVQIDYGVVTVMTGKQYPGVYFSDMPASMHLTNEEKLNAKLWEKHGSRFRTLVRAVYWGNVLSKSHWGNDTATEKYLLSALHHECAGNVFWIDDDTVFFCAPVDILEYEQKQKKIDKFKRNVRQILVETGIEVLELKQSPS